MPPVVHRATLDPALGARVVRSVPLLYAEGADAALDRPAHVRAASGMAWVPGGLAVVQDDANFIALADPSGAPVRAIALPAGEGGRRQFDDGRGTKRFKLDLEACFSVPDGDDVLFVAMGSGSTAAREQVVLVERWRGEPRVTLVHVPALYMMLRATRDFAGSELNVEGAAFLGDRVRLFNRGNGAPRDGVAAVNATAELPWPALLAHLRAPDAAPAPAPQRVAQYALGDAGGVTLTFTDGAAWSGARGERVLFSAAAEDAPDAVTDGPVSGTVLGLIAADGSARWAPIVDAAGAPYRGKVEGVAVAPDGARVHAVLDADDPATPSTLCEIELSGPWAE